MEKIAPMSCAGQLLRKCVLFSMLISVLTVVVKPSLGGSSNHGYRRVKIGDAKFGIDSHQALMEAAYGLNHSLPQRIKGQDEAIQVLQTQLIRFQENFKSPGPTPLAVNLMGLPGIGKSGLAETLAQLGFNVLVFDIQRYADGGFDFADEIITALADTDENEPTILLIEELDKVPEILENKAEITSPIIGALNQMLANGTIADIEQTSVKNVNNVFILTTMNFSPVVLDKFIKQTFKNRKIKQFFDMTVEDFQKFHKLLTKDPRAKYKILSESFRPNTVGRVAPNTVIMQPLTMDTYREIILTNVKDAIVHNTGGVHSEKMIQVEVDHSLYKFFEENTVYAPSGARETISQVHQLMDQLIIYGSKLIRPNTKSIDRPRNLLLKYDDRQKAAVITVTPLIMRRGHLVLDEPFDTLIKFNKQTKLFLMPENLQIIKPVYSDLERKKTSRITRKIVRNARFTKQNLLAHGLSKEIEKNLLGYGDIAKLLEDDLNSYLNRKGPADREPNYRVLGGFTGTGKSKLANVIAKFTKIPIIVINLQKFASDESGSSDNFITTIRQEFLKNHVSNKSKFILVLEGLDKLIEFNGGEIETRPVLGVLNELLSAGIISSASKNTLPDQLDVRPAYILINMNFPSTEFGFSADPRLTTAENMLKAYERINSSSMSLQSVLSTMFLSDTVGYLMPKFTVIKPPNQQEYMKIVQNRFEEVVRKHTHRGGKNVLNLTIEPTQNYLNYLYSESIVPAEGPRNTVLEVETLVNSHVTKSLQNLPRRAKYAYAPLKFVLDYNQEQQNVQTELSLVSNPEKHESIFSDKVRLKFPSVRAYKGIPEERMHTTIHEFGHAIMAVLMGRRFETLVVTPPNPRTGGYIKFSGSPSSAMGHVSDLYIFLASRAMERIFLSPDPLQSESVLYISDGASGDIEAATGLLMDMLHELGFEPDGGTVSYGSVKNALVFPKTQQRIGTILRALEDFIVTQFLAFQTKEWFQSKITELSKIGIMSEMDFYALIEHPHPGIFSEKISHSFPEISKAFGDLVIPENADIEVSRQKKIGKMDKHVNDYQKLFLGYFSEVLTRTQDSRILDPGQSDSTNCISVSRVSPNVIYHLVREIR